MIDPAYTWGRERPPARPRDETVIYELHAKGLTMRHPEVAEAARGTVVALSRAPVVDYLAGLGITAVELLPVHAFAHDRLRVDRGLRNYWGYNTLTFFAPHPEYIGLGSVNDFKTMVHVLHETGLEVLLDVVYSHIAEGNHLGPALRWRGIDDRSYYDLVDGDERFYNDLTGTGNTLELRHPAVLRMVTESLRYWYQDLRVDGLRFDLATTLARVNGVYDEHARFLDTVARDPLLVGDEFGRTQGGNTNAHCQDNEIGWLDWSLATTAEGAQLLAFVRRLLRLWAEQVVFHRSRFVYGRTIPSTEVEDVVWLRPDGAPMTEADWGVGHAQCLGVLLSGEAGLIHVTARGEPEPDDTFLLLFDAGAEPLTFTLPFCGAADGWRLEVDTARPDVEPEPYASADAAYPLEARSLVVRRCEAAQ